MKKLIILCLLAFGGLCQADKNKNDEDEEKGVKEVHVYHHDRREPRVGFSLFGGPWFVDDPWGPPYGWWGHRPYYGSGVSFNFGFSGGGGYRRHHRRH